METGLKNSAGPHRGNLSNTAPPLQIRSKVTTSPFSIVSTPSAATTSIFAPGLCSRAPWALQGRPARPASTALRATEDRLGPAACPAKLVYRGPQGQPARRATPGRPGRSAQSAWPAPTASPDCRWAPHPYVHSRIISAFIIIIIRICSVGSSSSSNCSK